MFFLLSEMLVFVNKKIKNRSGRVQTVGDDVAIWTLTNVVDAQVKMIRIILDNNIRNEKTPLLSTNATIYYRIFVIFHSIFFRRTLAILRFAMTRVLHY